MTANLYALFASRFPADRNKPCFILSDGAEISYGALEDGTARVARLLTTRGVAPGAGTRLGDPGADVIEARGERRRSRHGA